MSCTIHLKLIIPLCQLHALPSAAEARLDQHREADLLPLSQQPAGARKRVSLRHGCQAPATTTACRPRSTLEDSRCAADIMVSVRMPKPCGAQLPCAELTFPLTGPPHDSQAPLEPGRHA